MIYQEKFIDYLRENLGDPVIVKARNIVTRCPWCEYGEDKSHYHLYISTELPIFHCFHAGCNKSGNLSTLFKKIDGSDHSHTFVDESKIDREAAFKNAGRVISHHQTVLVPDLDINSFPYKKFYIQKRFYFNNVSSTSIPGLVFDIRRFVEMNHIEIKPRFLEYLHSNFVGFLTDRKSVLVLRNIDSSADFRFYKLLVYQTKPVDYYSLKGGFPLSNKFILGEGIFDIWSEQIFDYTNQRSETAKYIAVLSGSFHSTLKSIAFHELSFQLDLHILSDRDVPLNYYSKLKKYNSHLIKHLSVYYNKNGKDFNVNPVTVERFVM